MAEIILGYNDTELTGSLECTEVTPATNPITISAPTFIDYAIFDTIESFPPVLQKDIAIFKTLRGRRGNHTLARRRIYNIVLADNDIWKKTSSIYSSDILEVRDNFLNGFLKEFWEAPYKYICKANQTVFTGRTFDCVETEQTEFPVEYIDGILFLPQLKFTLISTEPYTV
jgi:hypothetical protein